MVHDGHDTRRDLAAMLVPLGRSFTRAELPVLESHALTMWGYIVLTALRDHPASSQATLADLIGADRTRIIAVLDDLQYRKLINRAPDPEDRRSNVVSLTTAGKRLVESAQRAIQENENRLLATVSASDRAVFLRVLDQLTALGDEEFGPR